jgi:hypothetical protein
MFSPTPSTILTDRASRLAFTHNCPFVTPAFFLRVLVDEADVQASIQEHGVNPDALKSAVDGEILVGVPTWKSLSNRPIATNTTNMPIFGTSNRVGKVERTDHGKPFSADNFAGQCQIAPKASELLLQVEARAIQQQVAPSLKAFFWGFLSQELMFSPKLANLLSLTYIKAKEIAENLGEKPPLRASGSLPSLPPRPVTPQFQGPAAKDQFPGRVNLRGYRSRNVLDKYGPK